MAYNWQQADWPDFRFNLEGVEDALFAFAEQMGRVSGLLEALPDDVQLSTIVDLMVAEAIKTSEIEGEYLSRQDVFSSIRNRLGLNAVHDQVKDRKAQGAGELMAIVRQTFTNSLQDSTLLEWHTILMQGQRRITPGKWRTHEEPMQVVSGAIGREQIHFEAPPSVQVPAEMHRFIEWFNHTAPGGSEPIKKAPVRAAIAHLYFETIHPFEDGNGRIGRAIAEKALSQTIGRPALLSLSQSIETDRKAYYAALEAAQKSNEITPWIEYFVGVLLAAQVQAGQLVEFVLKKARLFDRYKSALNDRQMKAVNRMLEAGAQGFEGGMTANKYISITKASKATATRDLQELVELGVLAGRGGGRSTHYSIIL